MPRPADDTPKTTATRKAAERKTIGAKEVADHLGIEPRTLRAFLRKTERAVGRGTRYEWSSLNDPEVKKIVADWKASQAKDVG